MVYNSTIYSRSITLHNYIPNNNTLKQTELLTENRSHILVKQQQEDHVCVHVSKSKQYVCAYANTSMHAHTYTPQWWMTSELQGSAGKNTVSTLICCWAYAHHTFPAGGRVQQHCRMMDVGALPKHSFNWPFINLFGQERDSQRREVCHQWKGPVRTIRGQCQQGGN